MLGQMNNRRSLPREMAGAPLAQKRNTLLRTPDSIFQHTSAAQKNRIPQPSPISSLWKDVDAPRPAMP
jgi:hypothetical protein